MKRRLYACLLILLCTAASADIRALESFYRSRTDYDAAFRKCSGIKKEKVVAGIISHHFLARDLIARFFSGIDPNGIDRVIIVGPDHFHAIKDPRVAAITTTLPWETPYGRLYADKRLPAGIAREYYVPFYTEHSIYTQVPFVKHAFPNASIIPLVLGHADRREYYKIGRKLSALFPRERTLLVLSSDFCHHLSSREATIRDRASLGYLAGKDQKDVDKINCDCRNGVALLFGYLEGSAASLKLNANLNSGDFGGSGTDGVTSYVSAYYEADPRLNNVPGKVRILLAGDLMFDRYIRLAVKRSGNDFPFSSLHGLLASQDLVVANLEGPITNNDSVSVGTDITSREHYLFTFDPSLAKTLRSQNISVVNIGNNHILNRGPAGLKETVKYLSGSSIGYFGYTGTGAAPDFITRRIKGLTVSLVNYNQFVKGSLADALKELRAQRSRSGLEILFAHWGSEYSNFPNDRVRLLAHRFVDAGADLVVGTHPHVIQGMENYKGVPIYYSIGNFIFDQYFSEDTRKGLLLSVIVDKPSRTADLAEYPVYLEGDGRTVQLAVEQRHTQIKIRSERDP
ncbi:MAG TPA: AmmeMemoRadiSam system protein B [Candidatus Omnitrophota bacterium]|nr:AmmeMemoRadiSam system protein B [Candidatus Omnitrophota bacterium]